MYGPLLLLIILVPLFLVSIFFLIAPYQFYKHYGEKICYYDERWGEKTEFRNWDSEIKAFEKAGKHEELAQLQHNHKKYKFWRDLWQNTDVLRGIIFGLLLIAIIIFGLWCLISPIEARQEALYWQEFTDMVELTIGNAQDYQDAGIAGDIIEYNSWLSHARTSQNFWGNWSNYYYIDLSNLDYIKLN